MIRSALFISPHLDDVAFSCGGTLARLAFADFDVRLCTVFTRSVAAPQGFALRCQTEKGLAADVDYMNLRRAEDSEFARLAGGARVIHLDFAEAPHRGYDSAAKLFGEMRAEDDVWRGAHCQLQEIVDEYAPQIIFAPQGLGAHIDHLQTVHAMLKLRTDAPVFWFREMPYAMRDSDARASSILLSSAKMRNAWCDITQTVTNKIEAIEAYRTQLEFQFGGSARMRDTLRLFHRQEAQRVGINGAVERFMCAEKTDLEVLRPHIVGI